jgi:hypothetical protein
VALVILVLAITLLQLAVLGYNILYP